jgi:hypothetical protein
MLITDGYLDTAQLPNRGINTKKLLRDVALCISPPHRPQHSNLPQWTTTTSPFPGFAAPLEQRSVSSRPPEMSHHPSAWGTARYLLVYRAVALLHWRIESNHPYGTG